MLDGNQERVACIVRHPVTPAVVLHFYNDCLQLSYLSVKEKRPEKRVIVAAFALVTDKDCHNAARPDSFEKSLSGLIEFNLKVMQGLAGAQVFRIVGIPDYVPVGRMIKDQMKLFLWQRAA